MKRIFLSIFLCIFATLGMAQSTEQINPQDPNYNIELNAILQSLSANTSNLSINTQTLTGYFTSNLLNTTNGGLGQNISNWPSGDILYLSSTGTVGHEPLAHGVAFFTTSGTWTAPATALVEVSMVGGGGGGGGCAINSGTCNVAGPGYAAGGGASIVNQVAQVTQNTVYTITVGAGGAAGTNASIPGSAVIGGTGGASSALGYTANGGGGGTYNAAGSGGAGNTSFTNSGFYVFPGGSPGGSYFGTGGSAGESGYGGGGIGGANASTQPTAGAQGFVAIVY